MDQGGSTSAQHGLKRTQQQPNMDRIFAQHELSAACPKRKEKIVEHGIKNISNAAKKSRFFLGIYSVFDKIKASTQPKMAHHGPNMVPMWPKMAQDKP